MAGSARGDATAGATGAASRLKTPGGVGGYACRVTSARSGPVTLSLLEYERCI